MPNCRSANVSLGSSPRLIVLLKAQPSTSITALVGIATLVISLSNIIDLRISWQKYLLASEQPPLINYSWLGLAPFAAGDAGESRLGCAAKTVSDYHYRSLQTPRRCPWRKDNRYHLVDIRLRSRNCPEPCASALHLHTTDAG